jgi:putative AlgH/UPF0301 family transcriptional regulator
MRMRMIRNNSGTADGEVRIAVCVSYAGVCWGKGQTQSELTETSP